ncbi:barwin-like endoglucanase [Meredithblackwellia eburnea MCA 4105]
MKTFSTLAVVAALSSSAIATNLLHEKAGRLDRRHGNAHIAPQWIKRRSPIQRRQATSIVPGEASLLTVSNTTDSHSTAVPTTTATPTATVDTAALAASADAESSRLAKLSSASVASVASVKSQQAADAAASEAAASSSSAAAAAASSKAAALKQQQEQAAADAAASSSSAAAAAASSKAAAAKKASEEAAYQATHTVQAAAVQTTAASSSSSQTYTGGYATFYTQNGVAGACGKVNPDSALIIAQDSRMYNNGANCGRSITLTRTDNGASVTAVIADECPTCETATSLDLSVGAFTKIATEEEGMVPISWHYND